MISIEDIYNQDINFLFGSGASFGLLPTLQLQLQTGVEDRRYTLEELATKFEREKDRRLIPLFMYYYANAQYEEALSEALQMNVPTCIWDAIARAAAYAKLNMKPETKKAIAQLLALEPNFQEKQDRLLHAMVIDNKWVGMLAEGLAKGGL